MIEQRLIYGSTSHQCESKSNDFTKINARAYHVWYCKLDVKEFKRRIKKPKPIIIGLFSQLVLLPALTLGLIHLLNLPASIALGTLSWPTER